VDKFNEFCINLDRLPQYDAQTYRQTELNKEYRDLRANAR